MHFLVLSLLCSTSLVVAAIPPSPSPSQRLEIHARNSIEKYFSTSNRALKSLRWVDLSLLDRQNQEYLVEAEAVAQTAAYSESLAFYHCGVFTRRVNRQDWEVNLTACEAFAEAHRAQDRFSPRTEMF